MVVCSAALRFRACGARREAHPSVLLCMLFHASVNAVTSGYVFPLFGDADRSRLWWIYALVWVAGAAVIAWRSGPALSSGARS